MCLIIPQKLLGQDILVCYDRSMVRATLRFFDKLEDSIRISLSHYPIVYSLIGGFGIVLFWRGVWMFADEIYLSSSASILISIVILLSTGLFVSVFIGDSIILTGLRGEKKIAEKTEDEVRQETQRLAKIEKKLNALEKLLRENMKNTPNKDETTEPLA